MERIDILFPKIELHLHFRGSIPRYALHELALKYNPTMTDAAFVGMFDIHDIRSFLRTYDFVSSLIKTPEDFRFAASAIADSLARQNVIYIETSLSALSFKEVIEPYKAIEIAREEFAAAGVGVSFLGAIERHDEAKVAAYKYDFYKEARGLGFRGISLMGNEMDYSYPDFSALFRKAKEDGFGVSVHAGEHGERANIKYAVWGLGADRIGHGNNIGYGELAEHILEKGVHIEMCPLSNMRLNHGMAPEDHCLPRYMMAGMSVSINSDDAGIIGSSLSDNYSFAARNYGLTAEDFRRMQLDALKASFADGDAKAALYGKLR